MEDNTLIVFVRRPELGKVKTRLARTMGEEAALAIYLQLLDKTKQAVSKFNGRVAVYYSEESGAEILWARKVDAFLQKGHDLGERMFMAIQDQLVFSEKVVLMGSDCPAITPEIMNETFEALNRCDVVLGPTEDGGYYLIGMKKAYSELFITIPWSTSEVLIETRKRLDLTGLSVIFLPTFRDVDVEEDYWHYVEKNVLDY